METELADHASMHINQVKHNQVDDKLGKLVSQLVSADAKAEAACTAAKMADSVAKQKMADSEARQALMLLASPWNWHRTTSGSLKGQYHKIIFTRFLSSIISFFLTRGTL
jgi:hypothetical protein